MGRFTIIKNYQINYQSGQIIIIAVVFMAILLTMSAALVGYTTIQLRGERQAYGLARVLQIAEAGVDKAIYELNQNSGFAGESLTLGSGEVVTTVTTLNSNTKQISATAYIPNSANPAVERTVRAQAFIDTSTVSFNFGVQVGEGGLTMDNNSLISGNVFSNGSISGSGTMTGDASVGAGVAAAPDQQCTSYGADYIFDNNSSANRDISQKFTPTISGSLNKVQLYLKKTGSPSNLTVRIMPHDAATNQAKRNGQIGGNGSLASVGTGYGWIDVSFASAPDLTAGTTYWIVIDGSSNSASVYYTVAVDNSYACAGAGKFASNYSSNPPNWQVITGGTGADLNFKTFVGGITTTLTGVTVNGNARAQQMSGCSIGQNAYFENASTDCSVTGIKYPGTAAPAPQALPISAAQIADWQNDAAAGGTITGDFNPPTSTSIGPTVITGNLILDNNVALTLTGTVYVMGYVDVKNGAAIQMDYSYGSMSGLLLADQWMHFDNNGEFRGSGQPGSYLMLLTTSACTDGSGLSACTHHSGAVDLHNNVGGVIFYASQGKINLHNNVAIKELTAYRVTLSENATIDYESGLQNTTFSSGPGASWTYSSGSYVIVP